MKILPSIVLLATLASASATAAEPRHGGPSAKELMTRINAEGGKKVLSELWTNEQAFEALLRPVQAGDPDWFKVWIKLRAYSDAAASESIDISFARALPVAPERVLKLVGHGLELNSICGSPFIEPEPGVAELYERKTLAALARVRDVELKAVAKECSARVKLK